MLDDFFFKEYLDKNNQSIDCHTIDWLDNIKYTATTTINNILNVKLTSIKIIFE